MEVFKGVVERFGGPLPLGEFVDPRVRTPEEQQQHRAAALSKQQLARSRHPQRGGGSLGVGTDIEAAPHLPGPLAVSAEHTFLDRKNLFDAVLSDRDFSLVVSFLLGGARVDHARAVDGATPLHIAVAGTTRSITNLLHQRRHQRQAAGASTGDLFSMSDLPTAAPPEDEEETLDRACLNRLIISFLMDNGADVNAQARVGGETPLMVACAMQNIRAVNLLLIKSARMDVRDYQGRNCLSYAALHPHMLQTLLVWVGEAAMARLARETSLLHQVCRLSGSRFAALYLLEQLGLDVNAREGAREEGGSPNDVDGEQDGRGAVRVLVGQDAARSDNSGNSSKDTGAGDTPLHCAVETGDLALVITLLAKGADPRAANAETARTPLELAVAARNTAVSHCLRVDRKLFFVPIRFSFPKWLAWGVEFFVNHVGLRVVDVESAALWGPTTRAMAIRSLVKYCATAPSSRVEVYLAKLENATGAAPSRLLQLSDLAAFQYPVGFVAFALTPQLILWLSTRLFSGFLPNLAAVLFVCAFFIRTKRLDENAVGCRSLRSLGFFIGMLTTQALCLPLYTTLTYYSYHVYAEESHKAITLWLIPSAILSAVLGLLVVCVSPGAASSTVGHRKGIYASLGHARAVAESKGGEGNTPGLPRELVYSIDLPTMVKKPLRAQRCPQTNRVILRYDHYCAYLASPIGANNHRAFLGFLFALFSLLSCFYYYACAYHSMLSGASAQVLSRVTGLGLTEAERLAMKPAENLLFSTPSARFGYMYTQVLLPISMLLLFMEMYSQFFAIARSVTWFDLAHALDESSVYCFALGDRVYSLFDKGFLPNVLGFFLCREALAAVQYRVPQMNSHLRKAVEEHQRWRVAGRGDVGCGHDHGGAAGHAHAHAHGGGGEGETHHLHTHDGDDGGAHEEAAQTAQRAMPLSTNPLAAEAASTTSAATTTPHGTRGDGGEGGAAGLAQHIFQEMLRSGSDDIALARGGAGALGQDAQTQQDWEAAVTQAKAMFAFFRQTMASSAQSVLQSGSTVAHQSQK